MTFVNTSVGSYLKKDLIVAKEQTQGLIGKPVGTKNSNIHACACLSRVAVVCWSLS